MLLGCVREYILVSSHKVLKTERRSDIMSICLPQSVFLSGMSECDKADGNH